MQDQHAPGDPTRCTSGFLNLHRFSCFHLLRLGDEEDVPLPARRFGLRDGGANLVEGECTRSRGRETLRHDFFPVWKEELHPSGPDEQPFSLVLTSIFDLMECVGWNNQGVTGGHFHPLISNEHGDCSRKLHHDLFSVVIVEGIGRSWFLTLADNTDLGCPPTRSGKAASQHSRGPTSWDA